MQYRIKSIQTVFGEERERRLKLAFDIIWNLDIQKIRGKSGRSSSQNPDSPTVVVPTDKTGGDLGEEKNRY